MKDKAKSVRQLQMPSENVLSHDELRVHHDIKEKDQVRRAQETQKYRPTSLKSDATPYTGGLQHINTERHAPYTYKANEHGAGPTSLPPPYTPLAQPSTPHDPNYSAGSLTFGNEATLISPTQSPPTEKKPKEPFWKGAKKYTFNEPENAKDFAVAAFEGSKVAKKVFVSDIAKKQFKQKKKEGEKAGGQKQIVDTAVSVATAAYAGGLVAKEIWDAGKETRKARREKKIAGNKFNNMGNN